VTAFIEDTADTKSTEQHQERRRTNRQSKSSSRQLQLHDVKTQTKVQGLKPTCNDTSRTLGNSNRKNTGRKSYQTDVRLYSKTETYYTVGDYTREPAKERAL
jgi:hypothetical protein